MSETEEPRGLDALPAILEARKIKPLNASLRQLSSLPGPRGLQEPQGGEMRTHESGLHLHAGPIHSSVAGRTDHLPTHVESGSYVIPADIVSAHGEGNTLAGFKVLRRVFEGLPYGDKGTLPYGGKGLPYVPHAAKGGQIGKVGSPVPVVLAGGEYVLTPQQVMAAGDGDMDTGHKVLDDYVKQYRALTVKTLRKLPGPRQD